MSPRAACQLEALGFTHVHDYAPGKVDWLAHNLPIHGTAAGTPTIGRYLRHDVVTTTLDEPLADVRARAAASPYDFALVLAAGTTTLLGRLRPSVLHGADPARPAGEVMEPGPSTLRPTSRPGRSVSGWRTASSATRSSPTPRGTCWVLSTLPICTELPGPSARR